MSTAYTIVVPDSDLLSRICGTNDSNLDLIENYLRVPIFSKGNEISLQEDNPEIIRQFQHIIDRLLDEASAGLDVGHDLIHSIITGEKSFSCEQFKDCAIMVPGAVKKIYPKTHNQALLINAMRKSDMVFCTGPAGSGKTFLMVAEALRMLLSKEKGGIILTRPVVEAGENLGFLPGDLEQKINPYLRPLFDAINTLLPPASVKKLMESGVIETAPLAYMRGRTLNNSVIILDEAQNTTCEQMKMFLTRMGEGSKVFITGDVTQIDLPPRVPSGLVHATRILHQIDEIKMINFDSFDVVRNPLVRKIVQAYEDNKE